MASRPRHSDAGIEAVISEAETHGWTFTFKNSKFHARCGCGKHTQAIQNGGRPADRAARNFRSQLMQCPFWVR